MKNKVNLNEIFKFLDDEFKLIGTFKDIFLTGVASTISAKKNQLTFIDSNRNDKWDLLNSSKASVLIVDETFLRTEYKHSKILICVKNPKLIFTRIFNKFFINTTIYSIDKTAVIHPEAKIDENVRIESNCTIGNSIIKSGTIIKSNVIIGDNVEIGENVLINSGCILGSDGYGYVRDESKFPIQFPHVGGIIIENFVDLGSNTCIDNGSLTPTKVGYGSKIDNLVHIGHNVDIGKCVFIAANSSISGSSKIGDFSEIWIGVQVADGISIGKNCSIGIGSVVIKNVKDNVKCFGNPAREYATKTTN